MVRMIQERESATTAPTTPVCPPAATELGQPPQLPKRPDSTDVVWMDISHSSSTLDSIASDEADDEWRLATPQELLHSGWLEGGFRCRSPPLMPRVCGAFDFPLLFVPGDQEGAADKSSYAVDVGGPDDGGIRKVLASPPRRNGPVIIEDDATCASTLDGASTGLVTCYSDDYSGVRDVQGLQQSWSDLDVSNDPSVEVRLGNLSLTKTTLQPRNAPMSNPAFLERW